mmetsp:Transcript_27404/g.49329  ORF Transcript_27404/g.49329 Transcript_27404/m.49329 type:complete len:557 (-) Transcript_27404:844-2514(-)
MFSSPRSRSVSIFNRRRNSPDKRRSPTPQFSPRKALLAKMPNQLNLPIEPFLSYVSGTAPQLREELLRKRLLSDSLEITKLKASLRRHRQVFAHVLSKTEVSAILDSQAVESLQELDSFPDDLTKFLASRPTKTNSQETLVLTLSQQTSSLKSQIKSLQGTVLKLTAENKTLIDLSLPSRQLKHETTGSPRPKQFDVSRLSDAFQKAVKSLDETRLDDFNWSMTQWLKAKRVFLLHANETLSKFTSYSSGIATELSQHSVLLHAFHRQKAKSLISEDEDFDERLLRALGCDAVQMDVCRVSTEEDTVKTVLLIFRSQTCKCLHEIEMAAHLYSLVLSRIRGKRTATLNSKALELAVESCDALMQISDFADFTTQAESLIAQLLNADFVKMWLVDDVRKELYRRSKDSLTTASLHAGFAGYCIQTKKTVLANDATETKQFNRDVDAPNPNLNHVLATPICYYYNSGNQLPRAVVVASNCNRQWVEEDRRVVKLYSALVCRAADFVHLREELVTMRQLARRISESTAALTAAEGSSVVMIKRLSMQLQEVLKAVDTLH